MKRGRVRRVGRLVGVKRVGVRRRGLGWEGKGVGAVAKWEGEREAGDGGAWAVDKGRSAVHKVLHNLESAVSIT